MTDTTAKSATTEAPALDQEGEVETFTLPRTAVGDVPITVRGRVIGESRKRSQAWASHTCITWCRIIAVSNDPRRRYVIVEEHMATHACGTEHGNAIALPFADEQSLYFGIVFGEQGPLGPPSPARGAAWTQARHHPPVAAFIARLRAEDEEKRAAAIASPRHPRRSA